LLRIEEVAELEADGDGPIEVEAEAEPTLNAGVIFESYVFTSDPI